MGRGREKKDLEAWRRDCWRERGMPWLVSWKNPLSLQAV